MWIYFDLSCSLLECTLYLRTPISLIRDSPQQFIYFFKSSFSLLPPFSFGTYTRRMLEPFNCTIHPAARVIFHKYEFYQLVTCLQLSVLDIFLTTLSSFQLFHCLYNQLFVLTFFLLKNLISVILDEPWQMYSSLIYHFVQKNSKCLTMAWTLLYDVTSAYLLNLILFHSTSPSLYTRHINLLYRKDSIAGLIAILGKACLKGWPLADVWEFGFRESLHHPNW